MTTLEFYHHQVRAAYYDYAFWDVLPLFEFFCLARILPYMTNLREKQCVVEGLRRVFGDVDISRGPSDSFAARSSDEINTDVTRLYEPSTERVSVIVPALGPDMGRIYADGQIKLLAINVCSPFLDVLHIWSNSRRSPMDVPLSWIASRVSPSTTYPTSIWQS